MHNKRLFSRLPRPLADYTRAVGTDILRKRSLTSAGFFQACEADGNRRRKALLNPAMCVCRLARPKMLIQHLGCGFQNEATITAPIQMLLNLTCHARRELSFQVPAKQMDGIPTVHVCPTSSGPAWVDPFSSGSAAIRHGEKLFKMEHM